MHQRFRLFVQRHDNGTYTVTAPGVERIELADIFDENGPAASSLAAHGLFLEEVKEDMRQALAKWLSRADPADLNRYSNCKDGQTLEKVEMELRASDRHGRKRADKIQLRVSLILTPQEDKQYLVTAPKLSHPSLSFYCYNLSELKETATRELAAYFGDVTLENLLPYQHQRQEFLDEIEVSFTPLKPQTERKKREDEESHEFWALKAAGVNLSARVREGRLQRAYRRDSLVNTILQTLAAERGNSLMLVGPSGAGKTAIVHEAVRRIREDDCPKELQKRQVWFTTPNQLIAGCSFIGQWEAKLQNVIDEVKKQRHILFIDDAMGLIEQGRTSVGDDNMAQYLKPFLSDGTVVMIGESSSERYRIAETRDPGFLRLFRTIEVAETSEEATLSILSAVIGGLEREHKVRILPQAAEAAVEMTRRFQPYRAFPGKAVSLVEQVATDTGKAASEERITIDREAVVRAFARQSGLPEFLLSDQKMLNPDEVERHFSARLIGQPDAVRTVVDLVTIIKAGLNDPNKPLGCFFFVGPTGVGKTEMAKALAEYLFGSQDRILRYDMSEYADSYNLAKLIGSGWGESEGELTKRIRLQPFSVVLLDEFEKANPAVFDLMLQVLGEGRLTDAGGRTADFRSAIVLMTSNLGASEKEQRRLTLREDGGVQSRRRHFLQQVEQFFRPEFVNRLDAVVVFRSLDRDAMLQIASREVTRLLEREGIKRRNLLVEMDDGVLDLLLHTGFSPVYGARPLKREIERQIIVPLARYLVAHRITGGHYIRIACRQDEIVLLSSPLTQAKQMVKRDSGALVTAASARKLGLRELIEGIAAVRLHLDEWAAHETVREIENEYRRLLGKTRRRNFVPYGPEAHQIWSRIYHLERLTKRLRQLKERAEYLEEFSTLTQRENSVRYLEDLAQSYAELCRDTDYLEVELLCAHMDANGQALLRLAPVGQSTRAVAQRAWMLTLAKMYLRWANRKGYAYGVFLPTKIYSEHQATRQREGRGAGSSADARSPLRPAEASAAGSSAIHASTERPNAGLSPWEEMKAGDFASLLKRLEEAETSEIVISLKGVNVYGFLKGEAGAHKLLIRSDDDPAAPFQTTGVEVENLPADSNALEVLIAAWEDVQKEKEKTSKPSGKAAKNGAGKPVKDSPPAIIRLYAPDGDRFVRDLRTEVETTQVRDVLDGNIDEFILAFLKAENTSEAWNRVAG